MTAGTCAERVVLAQPVVCECQSGGYLIHAQDGGMPIWQPDMGAVRRFLLERDLTAAAAVDPI